MVGRRKAKEPQTAVTGSRFGDAKGQPIPLFVADQNDWSRRLAVLTDEQRNWIAANGVKPASRRVLALPGHDGAVAAIFVAVGDAAPNDPFSQSEIALGLAAAQIRPGAYALAHPVNAPELAAVAFGLGSYRYGRYKSAAAEPAPVLDAPDGADALRIAAIVEGVALGRDLINTPSSDMGPADLEQAARTLAERHRAGIATIVGDDLLSRNFPLIHAVGRASPRAPRLIDLSWGRVGAPKVTLVGKGICFDTGGLDLKAAAGMLLMKKDMGGAATVLALGHMIMATGLDVRLRILIPAAENSVAGNAFRPGDVIRSRAGITVEIGNTDAEGRLVLADALALADEEAPEIIATVSTLTGAARTALGPDLPALYVDDDELAAQILQSGLRVADPFWRMPFWPGYATSLDSSVADINNVSGEAFAGSVIAALFLRRFVTKARSFAHFDAYCWRQSAKALGPRGGEAQGARGLFAALETRYRGT